MATPNQELEDLVASSDTGSRRPGGLALKILLGAALLWSLFQLWYASPLRLVLDIGIDNSTQARSVHLAFAMFLAFISYPALKHSPRNRIPLQDWTLAIVGGFCAGYLALFYGALAERPADPTWYDVVVSCIGMVLLLEATRRALGPPLAIVATVCLVYVFIGPWMPTLIAHRGASLFSAADQFWLTTSGVFGTALGVSTKFVFLFVLFGALLDKAGAGNYFIRTAFALLGHLRGGPAKAAVVASGMTGLISGSSIANVVTTGTFTIPLMKRVGFSAEKAGAVEVASSVNGQIMPPVMGAAAFLMVEYVGIPYEQVIMHAALPAVISYIALAYMVHLEALKAGMQGLPKTRRGTAVQRALTTGLIVSGFVLVCVASYYAITAIYAVFGSAGNWVTALAIGAAYIGLLVHKARYPELPDSHGEMTELPETGPTVKAGLHFLLPVAVLVWCLMIERLSPGLSAFWATAFMIVIMITQRPLLVLFRRAGDLGAETRRGLVDLVDGLISGARNMIGIGVATATAGVVVGTVTMTGLGAVMTDIVEVISGGQLMLVLIFTAIISLILGMGLPTTANYIVVSTLMVPVVRELGQQSGLIVPDIAMHLFVFYFGIMADVTPPVGLASFAAAAVSGGDPIRTGFTAFFYSLRTAILPFLFIFNTDLLLIDVTAGHAVLVVVVATIAMLVFAAATQGWWLVRLKAWEVVALLLICFTLFRPGAWMDLIEPPWRSEPGARLVQVMDTVPPGTSLQLKIDGFDLVGNPRTYFVDLVVPEGDSGTARLEDWGLTLMDSPDKAEVDMARFGSPAAEAGLAFEDVITRIRVPTDPPPKELMYIPALLLLGLIGLNQRRRLKAS